MTNTNDNSPTITHYKLNGDPTIITSMIDYLYKPDTSMWSSAQFNVMCKWFLESVIESYNHDDVMSCQSYDVKLHTDGSFYLTTYHYEE